MLISNNSNEISVYWAGKTFIIPPFGFLSRAKTGWDKNIEQKIIDIKSGKHVYKEYKKEGQVLKLILKEVHEEPYDELECREDEDVLREIQEEEDRKKKEAEDAAIANEKANEESVKEPDLPKQTEQAKVVAKPNVKQKSESIGAEDIKLEQ